MRCIICEKARDEEVYPDVVDRIKFKLSGVGLHEAIHSCPICGYTWLYPPIPTKTLEAYYAAQSRWPSESIAYHEQVEFIAPYIHPDQKVRILDIGSYDRRFLQLCKDKLNASAVFGVEPDEEMESDFKTLADAHQVLGPAGVDIVTMGHVFEHIHHPFIVLKHIKSMLSSGGLLMIEVPNLEDPQIQMVPYWTPFHHSYFTPTTLNYMLEVAGFQIQAVQITGYRSVRILARSFSQKTPNWEQAPPPQNARIGITKYLKEREILLDEIREMLFALYPDRLAIFGTGDHTAWLLKEFPDIIKHTDAFLNSNPTEAGYRRGIPIYLPENCPDEIDTIICSSYDSQAEMAQAVGKRAFQFYDDVRAYDVWQGDDYAVSI